MNKNSCLQVRHLRPPKLSDLAKVMLLGKRRLRIQVSLLNLKLVPLDARQTLRYSSFSVGLALIQMKISKSVS